MRLINNNDLDFLEFESKSELEEYLRLKKSVLVNENCKDKKKFYGIGIKSNKSDFIGIFGGAHGIKPTYLFNQTRTIIFINIDEVVYSIDLEENEVIWTREFDSIVYTLIKLPNSSVLVICELGVTKLSFSGECIWEHTSDIITDYKLVDDSLMLYTDDNVYSLSLEDGKVI